ncbi:MAG: YbaK/EbsC family protein [Nitriliruptorales bacterium]|nr:YbaK/EbsC family protein [Nitriliruptorales bacterium]
MSGVTDHLEARGVDFEVVPHPPAQTAEAEAHLLGVDPSNVAKTVVLNLRTGHAFAVVPADCSVDIEAVKTALNTSHVALSHEDDIARDYPEFELGAVPPMGDLARTPLVVDPSVIEHDEIIFAAGSQTESVRMSTKDLFDRAMMKVHPIT